MGTMDDWITRRFATAVPGVRVQTVVDNRFARHDHDGDGAIDLRPRAWDEQVQDPAAVPAARVGQLVARDERVSGYAGDVFGDGVTLPVRSELSLLMRAAQLPSAGTDGRLAQLELRPRQLHDVVASFDVDRDGALSLPELFAFHQRYSAQTVNYRLLRVLQLGEWRQQGAAGVSAAPARAATP